MSDYFSPPDLPAEAPESPDVHSQKPDGPAILHFGCDGIPRISPSTYAALLTDSFSEEFERVETLDCRFAYEYEAGCVCSSINLLRYNQMVEIYSSPYPKQTAFVFFCEFSSVRGPRWAALFREYDRSVNSQLYPWIKFPHVFIVEGGFAAIVREVPFIVSGKYRTMNDFEESEVGMVRLAHQVFEKETERNWTDGNSWGKLSQGLSRIEGVPFGRYF
jgi:M-phase inducer tyrosine phosphatase